MVDILVWAGPWLSDETVASSLYGVFMFPRVYLSAPPIPPLSSKVKN